MEPSTWKFPEAENIVKNLVYQAPTAIYSLQTKTEFQNHHLAIFQ